MPRANGSAQALPPPGRTLSLSKSQVIYDSAEGADSLYQVVHGLVSVCLPDHRGDMVVARCVGPGGLFGESCLSGRPAREMAIALRPVTLLAWAPEDVLLQSALNPALALMLVRHLAARSTEVRRRVAANRLRLSHRLALALLELSASIGEPGGEGRATLFSVTHATLADYVGAARELVTKELIGFRARGLVDYSHGRVDVRIFALRDYLSSGSSRRVLAAGG